MGPALRSVLSAALLLGTTAAGRQPNIVVVLTDDQDITLGGMEPMNFTGRLLTGGGVTFENAFVSTPVCCPSRSSLLTGRYQHNTGVLNNSVAGECSGPRFQRQLEPRTFAVHLHRAGYRTLYAGKYLNQYGRADVGGVQHVPEGWDWWAGLVGNSRYYNYTLSVNGTARRHGSDYQHDYLTDVIKRYALDFLQSDTDRDQPFLMMLAPPAAHAPFTPAPQYSQLFADRSIPRTASFNVPVSGRHSLLDQTPLPLPQSVLDTLEQKYRDRLRTLVSVDDLVAAVVAQLEADSQLNNTYILFTSDHGYHLGQFSMVLDKRQPYEFDLRVPLYLWAGPGEVPAGARVTTPVTLVDLAPTLLDLAGLPVPEDMDGVSLLQTLDGELGPVSSALSRTALLVSYTGEYGDPGDPRCAFRGHNGSHCYQEFACKCQDNIGNTYTCIREMASGTDTVVCYFALEDLWEVYNIAEDPDQIVNLGPTLSKEERQHWRDRLDRAAACSGRGCINI